MPDAAGFRLDAARVGAKVRAMMRAVGTRGAALIGAGLALVCVFALAGQWLLVGRHLVTTENASVRADISLISAKVEGYVRAAPAVENQPVRAGDVLVEIDPTDYEARVEAARAALAQARSAQAAQRAQRARANAEVNRYRPLAERGILSPARMRQIENEARQAGTGLAAANAAVAAARADLEETERDLGRVRIHAPIDGVVTGRQVEVGQFVRAGAPLMAVVPLQSVYVVANFKEAQVARFRPGQAVIVQPDMARAVRLRGWVESIAPASGSALSGIPTGDAEIAERVPVRIRFDPGQEGVDLLRPGLSARVTVDTQSRVQE